MNWLKITPAQAATLAALNASTPTNYHIAPVKDAAGNLWVKAELRAAPEYAHFAAWLAQDFTAQGVEPIWPAFDA
jgi:hypothetical protein